MPSSQSQGRYLKQAHRAWLMACIPSCLEQHARHAADSSETKQAKSHRTGLASSRQPRQKCHAWNRSDIQEAFTRKCSVPFPNAQCLAGLKPTGKAVSQEAPAHLDLILGARDVLAAIWADLVEGIRSLPTAPPSHHGSPQLAAAVADRSGYFLSSSIRLQGERKRAELGPQARGGRRKTTSRKVVGCWLGGWVRLQQLPASLLAATAQVGTNAAKRVPSHSANFPPTFQSKQAAKRQVQPWRGNMLASKSAARVPPANWLAQACQCVCVNPN
nr:unnamed protein product [Digitaria exilis]